MIQRPDDEGWSDYCATDGMPPQPDLWLQFEGRHGRFIARPQDICMRCRVKLRWRLTGIAKHQLEQKGYRKPEGEGM
jgi:hypothetical protein